MAGGSAVPTAISTRHFNRSGLNLIITCVDRVDFADLSTLSETLIALEFEVIRFETARLLHEVIDSLRASDFGQLRWALHVTEALSQLLVKLLQHSLLVVFLQVIGANHLVEHLLEGVSERCVSINR